MMHTCDDSSFFCLQKVARFLSLILLFSCVLWCTGFPLAGSLLAADFSDSSGDYPSQSRNSVAPYPVAEPDPQNAPSQGIFTITVKKTGNGTVSPVAATKVKAGRSQTFVITPGTNYHIDDVLVDGVSVGVVRKYTFHEVRAPHTLTVKFDIDEHSIKAAARVNGAISPSGTVSVPHGARKAFHITPDAHYRVADVLVDGKSVGPVKNYTFPKVTKNHTISAAFVLDAFSISASAGDNGSISPTGDVTVNYGAGQIFAITPATHYHVADVQVDGVSVGPVSSYTFSNVAGKHSIRASFAVDAFTIKASAGPKGSVSPSGDVKVNYGASQAFSINPEAHYHVADVLVDGSSVGAVTSYTLPSVAGDHTLAAVFAVDTFNIAVSAGANGSITPSGALKVDYGADQVFTITPDPSFRITEVLVDGNSVGAVSSYTLSSVSSDHTISAGFARASVTLQWDPSPDPSGITGYKIHYGTSSRSYPNSIDVGNQTTYGLTGLSDGVTYYAAATAYNSQGQESAPSEEISFALTNGTASQQAVPPQKSTAHSETGAQAQSESTAQAKKSGPIASGTQGASSTQAQAGSTGARDTQDQSGIPSPPYRILAGLGPYSKDGGWIEVIGVDHSHQQPIRIDWPEYNSLGGAARIATGDIDGDGKDEVIIGLAPISGHPGIPGGMFEILDHDFKHLTWGRINWPEYNKLNGETWPVCGDLDGDGKAEIIVGMGPGGKGKIEIFEYTPKGLKHKAWAGLNWKEYNTLSGEIHPAAGDIDWDGKAEIILGLAPVTNDPSIPGGAFEVLDNELQHRAWGKVDWDLYNTADGETKPVCGDVNGDGKDEILLGLGPKSAGCFEICEYDTLASSVKHVHWQQVPWEEYRNSSGETKLACGNLDADNEKEILVGLGRTGKGYIGLFDDEFHGYAFMGRLQTRFKAYNKANGETFPAVMSDKTGVSGN